MENYIVIGGKKAELTEEQLKALGIEPKRKNPFDRAEKGGLYWYVNDWLKPHSLTEVGGSSDQSLFEAFNYFNDEDFANQVILHELLNRRLLKYAYDNEAEDGEWDGDRKHYFIYRQVVDRYFDVSNAVNIKRQEVYFSKREIAKQAIEDVVKPFMAKHPEFVW